MERVYRIRAPGATTARPDIPPDFDPMASPIIAVHWFGLPPHLRSPLRRLAALRYALNEWDAAHGAGDMPQPADHNLRLSRMRPSQVTWGRAS